MGATIVILVAAHLLAVNLAGAGPIVAVAIEWRGSATRREVWRVIARRLVVWSIGAAAFGMGLGLVAAGALIASPGLGQPDYWGTLARVPAGRWWFTGVEIVFYYTCLAAYVLLVGRMRWLRWLLAIAAGTNLLYHFPALFTILAILPARPELGTETLDRSLFLKLLTDVETLSRVAHVWLASFAVTGAAVGWIAYRFRSSEEDAGAVRAAGVAGWRTALGATLLQVPVGVWVLMSLPIGQQNRVMGSGLAPTGLFALSILGALALLHQLAMLSLGDVRGPRIKITLALLASVVLTMTATLYLARG